MLCDVSHGCNRSVYLRKIYNPYETANTSFYCFIEFNLLLSLILFKIFKYVNYRQFERYTKHIAYSSIHVL